MDSIENWWNNFISGEKPQEKPETEVSIKVEIEKPVKTEDMLEKKISCMTLVNLMHQSIGQSITDKEDVSILKEKLENYIKLLNNVVKDL